MNVAELVKKTCKEKGISIAKLERDLDFGNGYIGKYKKDVFPVDKAIKISEYLGIDIGTLIGLDKPPVLDIPGAYYIDAESAQFAKEIYEDPDLRALFHAVRGVKKEDLKIVKELAERLKATNPDG